VFAVSVDHHEQHQAQPDLSTTETLSQADILAHAATLLVEIAGPEPVHIEMSPRGPKKYYDVGRAITAQDTRAHLKGWKTKGAYLRRPDGMTRALCYDADNAQDWEHLLDTARFLAEAGYLPIVEDSPVGRGGHLWIIYTRLVSAPAAHQHLVQVAPMLQHIKESWPGPGPNKIRLPGGKYIKPGFAAWCKLHDAHGGQIAEDGQSAARVLLDYQTPAEIVPEDAESQEVAQSADDCNGQNGTHPCNESPCNERQPGVDQHWQEKYGRYLWFQFTPAQLATWYNERNQVEDILPPEKNGMGLASWRGEHTASVGLREDGWVDFGASARRSDGKQDGGDALELTVRVNEEPKPEVMHDLARQLVSEAREAMESAARCGEQPPQWVQAFMSPAGWQHYRQLREEAGHSDQAITASPPHIGGAVGSCSKTPAQAAPEQTQRERERVSVTVVQVSRKQPDAMPAQETLQALATEIGAAIGKPCEKCSCTLYRNMAEYQVCIRCYPPRGYHAYSDRVDALYP
jgi:hypothetical protein